MHSGRAHPGESSTDASSIQAGVGRLQGCPCVCREGEQVLAQVRAVPRQDGSEVSPGLCPSFSGQHHKCEGFTNTAAWEQREKGREKLSCRQLHWETEKYRLLWSWAASCLTQIDGCAKRVGSQTLSLPKGISLQRDRQAELGAFVWAPGTETRLGHLED